ncbi:hypothetical protein [Rhodococcus qingshengii]|uniref:hypothetical protein n=1 Tax=Rhodococcus qingshengii TaxID=334542 RepID=UPI001F3C5F99
MTKDVEFAGYHFKEDDFVLLNCASVSRIPQRSMTSRPSISRATRSCTPPSVSACIAASVQTWRLWSCGLFWTNYCRHPRLLGQRGDRSRPTRQAFSARLSLSRRSSSTAAVMPARLARWHHRLSRQHHLRGRIGPDQKPCNYRSGARAGTQFLDDGPSCAADRAGSTAPSKLRRRG